MTLNPPSTESKTPDQEPDLLESSPQRGADAAVLEPETAPVGSPTAAPESYAPQLSAEQSGEAPARAAVVRDLQQGYGNDYVQQVVDSVTKGEPAAAAESPASAPAKTAAPAPAPAPKSAPAAEVAAEAKPEPEAKKEPEAKPAEKAPAAEAPTSAEESPTAAAAAAAPAEVAARATEPGAEPEATEASSDAAAAAPASAGSPAGAAAGPAGGAAPSAAEVESAEAEADKPKPEGKPEEGAAKEAPKEGGEAEVPKEERAPASAAEDPAFQAVVAKSKKVAHQQGHNNPAARKAAEAQAAAKGPDNEVASQAAAAQVDKMGAQEPAPFDKASFKAALLDKIAAITPTTLKEADEFKKKNKAGTIKGAVTSQVASGKEGAQSGIQGATEAAPDPSAGQPKEVVPQPPTEPGPAPGDVGAQRAAPKPKTDGEVSLEAGSQSLDQEMESADVTEKQLKDSNEPEFTGAVEKKSEAQTDAEERPVAYRQDEAGIVAGAESGAAAGAQGDVAAMHGIRGVEFGAVAGKQDETKTEDELKRIEVANEIDKIYQSTKTKVEARLQQLDDDVNGIFDAGAEAARQRFEDYVDQRMSAYKDERYSGALGWARWGKDKLLGMPKDVDVFYTEARALYIQLMDKVIDDVATAVETGLNEAMALIEAGRTEVQKYVASLPADLAQVGQDKAAEIQSQFDSLKSSVKDKGDQLVDSLAQKYADNLKAIDARIDEMKAANRGLVDAALGAIKAVIETILKLKDMLLGVLARAADVIGKIIKDPIGFVGNLVAGVGQGLQNFMANIGTHLQAGLMGWLFGAMADAGITMPATFDLKGILSLVMQVLGLTYANIRARAVAILGEALVARLEQVAEIFKILITEGPAGLWQYIKDQVGDLGSMILDGIKTFVIEKIVIAGITWIVSLLNPASAFIKACKAIYDIIMFFVTRGAQIMALVNAVLDSIAAIASGAIGGAAAAVENALAKALPVAISFLASLLGLGGISQKIKAIIMKIQAPVNKAIDWVIRKAVAIVKKLGKLLGVGGKKDEGAEDKVGDEADHTKLANKAAKELSAPEGDAAYDDLRQKKQAKAKQIEQTYSGMLGKGVGMKIRFADREKDQEDGDLDFTVVIAPNTTTVTGSVDYGDDLKKAKAAHKKEFFAPKDLAATLGVSAGTARKRQQAWVGDGTLFEVATGPGDPGKRLTFDPKKQGAREKSDSVSNRTKYGYSNPGKTSGVGLAVLSMGLRSDSPKKVEKGSAEYHKKKARYDGKRGRKNFRFKDAILGHDDSKHEGASGHWNAHGHKHTKADNSAWNRSLAAYWGPEHKAASAASGGKAPRYRVPGKDIGSHKSWWKGV